MSVMCIIELLPLFGIGYSGFQMLNIVKYIVLISIIISGTKNKNSNIFLCLIFVAMLFSVKTIVSYVSRYIHGYIDIDYFTRTAWSFFNALGELFFELWCLTLSPKVRRIFTKKMNFAYSNNSEKKAVATSSYKTIDECLQIDSVSKELWYWAEWFEKWGKAVFVLMIIGGLISSVIISNMDDDFNLSVFIINLSKNALYAFIEYVAYHTLSVLTGAVATITQNTRVTAKLAEYRTRKEENKVTANSNKQQRSETNDMPKL